MVKFLWFIVAGALGGVIGGMGMGGGTLLIPLLSIFYQIEQHSAQAVNLLCFIPMAIVAIIIHTKNKLVEYKGLWKIIIPAVILAILGSFVSKGLSGELLKKIFGGFLIMLSVLQFFIFTIEKKYNNSN